MPDVRCLGLTGRIPLQRVRSEARRRLEVVLRDRVPEEMLARLHIAVGRAAVVLAEEAKRHRAWLVVVGGKRHGALVRRTGGSTAHHLIRTLPVPVLVTGPSERPVERVLAAVDLSPIAVRTLRLAGRFAGLLGAELRVLHVVEPIKFPIVVPITRDDAEFVRQSEAAFERLLGRRVALPELHGVVRQGVAENRVAAEAVEWGADLVVVGSHGKGWADRLLIGSTTEALLSRLPTALLVVPAPAKAGAERRRRPVARVVI